MVTIPEADDQRKARILNCFMVDVPRKQSMVQTKANKPMVSSLVSLLFTLGIFYLLLGIFVYFILHTMMFPRQLISPSQIGNPPQGYERLWITLPFGRVETWFLPTKLKGPAPLVIASHGNAELIDGLPFQMQGFHELGYNLLLVEYPGYGRSEGSPSQKTITKALVRAYDNVTSRPEVDKNNVILWGRSIGGGASCALAAERPVKGMILISTLTRVKDFSFLRIYPEWLLPSPFNNKKVIQKFSGPVLFIHGTQDTIIPFSHGKKLYDIAQKGYMVSYPCGHNDCPPNWETYWKDMYNFLDTNNLLPTGN